MCPVEQPLMSRPIPRARDDDPDEPESVLPEHVTPDERVAYLQKRAGTILAYGSVARLSQMFDVRGWGLGRELLELVRVADQDEDLSSKLRAIAMIRQLRMDAIQLSGVFVQARKRRSIDAAGNETTEETINLHTTVQLGGNSEGFNTERGINPNEQHFPDEQEPNDDFQEAEPEDPEASGTGA